LWLGNTILKIGCAKILVSRAPPSEPIHHEIDLAADTPSAQWHEVNSRIQAAAVRSC
jgi:hypothetical protein